MRAMRLGFPPLGRFKQGVASHAGALRQELPFHSDTFGRLNTKDMSDAAPEKSRDSFHGGGVHVAGGGHGGVFMAAGITARFLLVVVANDNRASAPAMTAPLHLNLPVPK